MDEKSQNIYYPTSGSSGQVLAMNGVPTIEVIKILCNFLYNQFVYGHTLDGGFVIKFEEGTERKSLAVIKTKM